MQARECYLRSPSNVAVVWRTIAELAVAFLVGRLPQRINVPAARTACSKAG